MLHEKNLPLPVDASEVASACRCEVVARAWRQRAGEMESEEQRQERGNASPRTG